MLLREFSHENIVKLVNVHINHVDMSLYLAFDYAEHDLSEIIRDHREKLNHHNINQYTVKSLLWQLLNGLNYLHSNWIPSVSSCSLFRPLSNAQSGEVGRSNPSAFRSLNGLLVAENRKPKKGFYSSCSKRREGSRTPNKNSNRYLKPGVPGQQYELLNEVQTPIFKYSIGTKDDRLLEIRGERANVHKALEQVLSNLKMFEHDLSVLPKFGINIMLKIPRPFPDDNNYRHTMQISEDVVNHKIVPNMESCEKNSGATIVVQVMREMAGQMTIEIRGKVREFHCSLQMVLNIISAAEDEQDHHP